VCSSDLFTWATRAPGVRVVGRHVLAPAGDRTVRITLEIRQSGPLAGLVRALTGRRTARFLDLEARGLKAASEAAAAR